MTQKNTPPTIELVRHQDIIQPFMLNNSVVRGRMVRLDDCLNDILSRHQYPFCIGAQLAELMLLATMLASQLPEDGTLTLQIKGEGIVSFMVCDINHQKGLRAYANINDFEAANNLADNSALSDIIGAGYLAITLNNAYGEPYQGIVPLNAESLTKAVEDYFSQSQQLEVMFQNCIAAIKNDANRLIAAGIMLERMPDIEANALGFNIDDNHNWNYQKLLLETLKDAELTDNYLSPSALLYRIFNEDGVWIYDTQAVSKYCRCSRIKISGVLRSIAPEELKEMEVDGFISVICQFCNHEELFTLQELDNNI